MPTIEKNSLRWYFHKGNRNILYPSCTTVIGWHDKLFGRWRNSRPGDAANFGTACHYQVEKCLYDDYGVGNPKMGWPKIQIWNMTYEDGQRRLKDSMRMWFNFQKDYPDFKPLLQEFEMFYEGKYRCAGRLDQYDLIDGKKILLDLKTGGYWPEYNFQGAGYYKMLTNLDVEVDEVWLLFLDSLRERNPSNNYILRKYQKPEILKNVKLFDELLKEYWENNTMIINTCFEEEVYVY